MAYNLSGTYPRWGSVGGYSSAFSYDPYSRLHSAENLEFEYVTASEFNSRGSWGGYSSGPVRAYESVFSSPFTIDPIYSPRIYTQQNFSPASVLNVIPSYIEQYPLPPLPFDFNNARSLRHWSELCDNIIEPFSIANLTAALASINIVLTDVEHRTVFDFIKTELLSDFINNNTGANRKILTPSTFPVDILLCEGRIYLSLKQGPVVGIGTFKEVRYAVDIEDFTVHAVLTPKNNENIHLNRERFLHEIPFLRALQGVSGAVQMRGVIASGNELFQIQEYFKGGSLEERLKTPLSEDEKRELSLGISQALCNIHQKNIIHRDLKTPNVLLNGEGKVVICDFDLACWEDRDDYKSMFCGSKRWLAPEMLFSSEDCVDVSIATKMLDQWGLGCILYMIHKERPFPWDESKDLNDIREHHELLRDVDWFSVDPFNPTPLEKLLAGLFSSTPGCRPTSKEASDYLTRLERGLLKRDRVESD